MNAATSNETRLQAFGDAIDAIRKRVEAEIGEQDVEYIKDIDRFSRGMEILGRALLHFGRGPATFAAGVGALWVYKQLQATEVGHTALHGTFDKLEGAERYHSKRFRWDVPIDEESWRQAHNVRHHQYTNVVGRDPDVQFGPMRNVSNLPFDPERHRHGLRHMLLNALMFAAGINIYYTGVGDYYGLTNRTDDQLEFIEDRSPATRKRVWTRLLRKFIPYYAKELVLFPALAGSGWARVLAGNLVTEVMRDLYSAATIYCGHINEDVADYPEGTRAGSRAGWYKMQVEAAHNFEVPLPISQLCGALDLQIEHHLFPKFPTNRLREIAPEVRAVCEAHGVKYSTASWPATLKAAVRRVAQLSRPAEAELPQA